MARFFCSRWILTKRNNRKVDESKFKRSPQIGHTQQIVEKAAYRDGHLFVYSVAGCYHQYGVPYVTRYYAPALRKGVGQLLCSDETACKWTAKWQMRCPTYVISERLLAQNAKTYFFRSRSVLAASTLLYIQCARLVLYPIIQASTQLAPNNKKLFSDWYFLDSIASSTSVTNYPTSRYGITPAICIAPTLCVTAKLPWQASAASVVIIIIELL